MKLHYPPGATPLELEDLEDLLVEVTTQRELDRAEARNIIKAVEWAKTTTRLRKELLMVSGLLRLHEHMLGETWRWAGQYRNKNTNIGSDFPLIREEVPRLCGDATYWVENDTYPWPELAIRFHHRLAKIHPFVNGNGRHARLAADLVLEYNGHAALPWGGSNLVKASPERDEYIAALHEADREDYGRLVRFAQSG